MNEPRWKFSIDVGGTFTDVLARRPDGTLLTHKLLSSGATRGVVETGSTSKIVLDSQRCADPTEFWLRSELSLHSADGRSSVKTKVAAFDAERGALSLDPPLDTPPAAGTAYELRSTEEAPVVAIRYLMGLRLDQPIGPVDVRLGTTRATNALLERKGAKVAFVTTRGFADILRIGNQDRPELFKLHIRKRDELAAHIVEIDERLAADGTVLRSPDEKHVRAALDQARDTGCQAIAICLLHAHVNPAHEKLVADVAHSVGFDHVSVSSDVSRLERIVPRGDTTVVDAYLSPVIRAYLTNIGRSIPDGRLQVMTSNGGLVDMASASGKDTILSGPAGGVVGCAHVTRALGFTRTIGFDMGGTSTDVSRIDPPPGGFEYQHETVKAGVRIMTPMLAVETVAAGGGSICHFDGQKLVVGPESAGAVPGPACYGRGGPLTLTDMNVFLGRVPGKFFPFRLDAEAVERRLTDLARQVEQETSSSLTAVELADGFIRIANANMAAAVKQISISRGYDPREYVLGAFGGAGGQHACAIARTLGMPTICFSPFAGVLSALGIAAAELKRIGQRSVTEELTPDTTTDMQPIFEAMTDELRQAFAADGTEAHQLAEPVYTWDLCYAGQSTLLTVDFAPWTDAKEAFEKQHRQLYGYCHEDRTIELRVIRVELTAAADPPDTQIATQTSTRTTTTETTRMVVGGEPQEVPVHLRRNLAANQKIVGPAIVIEDTSTIVLDPGWHANVRDSGDIVATDVEAPADREVIATEADPIQLELFSNQFTSIAEQMGFTLRRTALSTNVKDRLDYSCAIFTPAGNLVVNAPHIPVHLGGMSDCVKALIEDVGTFAPGDVYITNDPYRGGSHLNDVTVIAPVHDTASLRLLFFVANRAHHAEIGGTRPGSMPPDSKSLADEGVLIRAFRWRVEDRPRTEELRQLLTAPPYPSRSPDENLADIAAQIAANQTGVRELKVMVDRYTVEVVHAYMNHIQAAAAEKMRRALTRLPDGRHRFEDRLDNGAAIRLEITINADRASLDFTGTDPVLPGNLNANRAIVTSAVLYCLRCLIDEDIPLNAGVLAPIDITLPTCFLNPPSADDPRDCPAIVGGNVETSQRVVDCVFGALKTVAASQGTMNNLLVGNATFGYYETICGGAGAGPGFDGADAVHTHMTNTRLTDPEVLESRYPVRLIRFAIRRGSGGRGRHRGGDGAIRELEFLAPLDVSILSQRRVFAPFGLHGGGDGRPGRNTLRRKGTEVAEDLGPIARFSATAGDRLTIETPGGGGYGSEHEPAHCVD